MAERLRERGLQLARGGYPVAPALRDGADAVPIRLLGRRSALVGGPEGVRRFYDPRLRRRGAFPLPIKAVLFGPGAVHGLDDARHHARKAMFLQVLTPEHVEQLAAEAADEWQRAVGRWRDVGRVVLFDEAVTVIGRSVLRWAGIELDQATADARARHLADIVDGFATPLRPWVRAATARVRADRWARALVADVRAGARSPAPGTALRVVADAQDAAGEPLPVRVAAVELLNVVRPSIAVAWFVAFAGRALREHPTWRARVAAGEPGVAEAFAQEVRRLYPFVPVLAARARRRQDVLGVPVPRGGYVLLDVHGTDHDPALWPDPDTFRPDRFLSGEVPADALVPQGGGDVATGHRCPGESAVLRLLTVAVETLARVEASWPAQELDASGSRMPTRPRSGVVFEVARRAATPVGAPAR